jgi:hypothetical protein
MDIVHSNFGIVSFVAGDTVMVYNSNSPFLSFVDESKLASLFVSYKREREET